MPAPHASSSRIVASGGAKVVPMSFDMCNAGVVLRAVLLVVVSVLTTSLFVPMEYAGWKGWALHAGLGLACAQPGALLWLMLVCVTKQWLARQSRLAQWLWCIVLGMGAACFRALCWPACGMCLGMFGQGACWLAAFWLRCWYRC